VHTLVANETTVVAFQVVEVGSPELKLRGRLRIKEGHTRRTRISVRCDVPGIRRDRGPDRVAIERQVCIATSG
jgi:hypothetical protein